MREAPSSRERENFLFSSLVAAARSPLTTPRSRVVTSYLFVANDASSLEVISGSEHLEGERLVPRDRKGLTFVLLFKLSEPPVLSALVLPPLGGTVCLRRCSSKCHTLSVSHSLCLMENCIPDPSAVTYSQKNTVDVEEVGITVRPRTPEGSVLSEHDGRNHGHQL